MDPKRGDLIKEVMVRGCKKPVGLHHILCKIVLSEIGNTSKDPHSGMGFVQCLGTSREDRSGGSCCTKTQLLSSGIRNSRIDIKQTVRILTEGETENNRDTLHFFNHKKVCIKTQIMGINNNNNKTLLLLHVKYFLSS